MCNRRNGFNLAIEIENKRLQVENKKLKAIVKKLLTTLNTIKIFSIDIIEQAQNEMSGNVPRGSWSLWKGRADVAKVVYTTIGRIGGL